MDTAHAESSTSDRIRALEPVLFFGGVLLAVAVAIALVTWEARHAPIGPRSDGPATVGAH